MFAKLLNTELERKGLKSIEQKADACGLQYEFMRQILKGKHPSDERIVEICNKLSLSSELVGRLLVAKMQDRAKDPATKLVLEMALVKPSGNAQPIELPLTDYYTAPVWSSVQAGTGHLSEQTAEVVDEVLLATEEYKAKCFAIQIKGDSMEPEIKDGDIGIFEPPNGLQPAENDVVIVELEGHGQWMVKRLKINGPSRIELISSNQDNPPIRVSLDTEKIEIKGILLRTVRKFKKRLFLK